MSDMAEGCPGATREELEYQRGVVQKHIEESGLIPNDLKAELVTRVNDGKYTDQFFEIQRIIPTAKSWGSTPKFQIGQYGWKCHRPNIISHRLQH